MRDINFYYGATMKKLQITTDNKSYIVKRYCDYVESHMDDHDIYDSFKEYFFREKMGYPIETLTQEINRHCPDILEEHLSETVIGKDKEYDFYANPVDITE